MTTTESQSVTRLLAAVSAGEAGALERLWKLLYDELRVLAGGKLAGEAPGHTLQPTALVNEVFIRLFGRENVQWENRRHFFGATARAMEHILVEHARKKRAVKRGGKWKRIVSEDVGAWFDRDPVEVLAVSEARKKLAQFDPRKAELVRLRYFSGLTVDETARALGVSPRTVDEDWSITRAWLYREFRKGDTSVGVKDRP